MTGSSTSEFQIEKRKSSEAAAALISAGRHACRSDSAFVPILRRFAVARTPIVLVRAISLHRYAVARAFAPAAYDCRHRRWSGEHA